MVDVSAHAHIEGDACVNGLVGVDVGAGACSGTGIGTGIGWMLDKTFHIVDTESI